MTINIHFDTGSASREELTGLAALLGHITPVALPMEALRRQQERMHGGAALTPYGKGIMNPVDEPIDDPRASVQRAIDEQGLSLKIEPNGDVVLDKEKAFSKGEIQRERGKPAPGRARRTKEEIAEDEAADKADASAPVQQSISTGEERVAPEDDAETQAQDAADEEAEENPAPETSIPDLIMEAKNALGAYVQKHGADVALEDGAAIFKSVLGEPTAGAWKWGLVAEMDRAKVVAVVDAWKAAAAAKGRFGA